MIKTFRRTLFAVAATALAGLAADFPSAPSILSFAVSPAYAIVGAPLTPVSVAGVARRTTRRNVAYSSAAYGAAAVAPVATTAAVATTATVATTTAVAMGTRVATLPAGCASVASAYYNCGGTYYRQAYEGPNVVYVVSPAP
jgi:hypothetical protein